jgi:hypothetical protein
MFDGLVTLKHVFEDVVCVVAITAVECRLQKLFLLEVLLLTSVEVFRVSRNSFCAIFRHYVVFVGYSRGPLFLLHNVVYSSPA